MTSLQSDPLPSLVESWKGWVPRLPQTGVLDTCLPLVQKCPRASAVLGKKESLGLAN